MRNLAADERAIVWNLHDAGKGHIEIARILNKRRTQEHEYFLLTYVLEELHRRGMNMTKESGDGIK